MRYRIGEFTNDYITFGTPEMLGSVMGRYDSGNASKLEVAAAIALTGADLAISAVGIAETGAHIGSAVSKGMEKIPGSGIKGLKTLKRGSSKTITELRFSRPFELEVGDQGITRPNGNIVIDRIYSKRVNRITKEFTEFERRKMLKDILNHERAHWFLTRKGKGPLVIKLQEFNNGFYAKSPFFRAVEEAVAEFYVSRNLKLAKNHANLYIKDKEELALFYSHGATVVLIVIVPAGLFNWIIKRRLLLK